MKRSQQSHLLKRPCIRCHKPTPALQPGNPEPVQHPLCPRCQSFLAPKPKKAVVA
jgi:hypothetical protein